MRYFKPEKKLTNIAYGRQILQNILRQHSPKEKRPCPNCTVPCPCSKSTVCCCQCSWKCPFLSIELSSDPIKFPIEAGILPLVYAMNSLHCCTTYSSCEGHENSHGELRRPPRLYFYSDTVIIPSIIVDYLRQLIFKKP